MPLPPHKSNVAVLSADDSLRRQIAECLGGDFGLEETATPEKAYQLLERVKPDILVLDLNSGKDTLRDGLELINRIGNSGLDTLIVVLNDDPRQQSILRVMAAGAYDCLLKPVSPAV